MQSHLRSKRIKFKTTQDWYNFLSTSQGQYNLLELRRNCYKDIEQQRNRPLLVYATKFIEQAPPDAPIFIDIPDIDGFSDLIQSVKEESNSVDVLLHSPGGRPDATERLVELLRSQFTKVDFLIPHSAYSAATMLALSGDNIILHPNAILGPIDPQINGVPARMIKNSFEKIKKTIDKEGPEALLPYIPLIEKYSLDLLELCEDSEKLSIELVSSWLKKYMLKDEKNNDKKIDKAVKYFSNYDEHLMHSRPLSMKKLSELGLKIRLADDTLQDLLWEAHILINGFFNIPGPFVKLYENTKDISWGRFSHMLVSQHVQNQKPTSPR